MQQPKYPNFDDFKYSQQQSQNQDLQQYLVSKTNDNIKYVPVLIHPQQINYLQPQVQQFPQYQQNYVIPQAEQQNMNFNPEASNLLKDQDFQKQKGFLYLILGIYIFWFIFFALLFYPFYDQIYEYHYKNSSIPLPQILLAVSSFTIMILAKLGIAKYNRNLSTSFIILCGLVLSYTLFYIALDLTLDWLGYHDSFYWVYSIGRTFSYSILGNFMFNFVVIIYLMFAETEIKIFYPILFEFFILFIYASIYDPIYYYCIIFQQIYAFCLMNNLKQILKGRFELKKEEIFAGAIAAFYGYIDCCTN